MFEAEGLNEEGAEYYTKMLQVTQNGVKQISVRIREYENLVDNVKNGKYTPSNKRSYPLGGHSIAARDYAQDGE